MKDRFRFRVFDYDENKMVYFSSLIGIETPHHDRSSQPNLYNDYVYHKISNYMQCAGLKDRNRKLIYEYDVVRFGQEDEDIGIIMWNEDECKFVVNEEFNKSLSDFSNWYGEDLEILGNIFEHDFFGKDTTAWLKASNIL